MKKINYKVLGNKFEIFKEKKYYNFQHHEFIIKNRKEI